MKKIAIVASLLVVLFSGSFLGQNLHGNAVSKVELEALVQEQQITIDNLTSQLTEVNDKLSETTKRLEALESKENSTEGIETRLTKVESNIGDWIYDRPIRKLIDEHEDTLGHLSNRISLLEKINKVDEASIQEYINNLPQNINNAISMQIYNDSFYGCGYSPYPPYQNNCTYPIEKDSLIVQGNIGSNNYNIFNYMSEEKFKELVINAYNENKSDKVTYKNIKVYVNEPFNLMFKIIEIPLQ
ncbi:hypothetical protein ABLO26_25450 [Neobacillus sp. 179-J 1A1 HS]|uniref:hypothetical protein n=1 Tax=Neobacillus driksii TaxID=3035913 RepID=UPI0035BC6649